MNLNAVNRSVTLLSRMFDPTKPTQSFLPPTTGKPLFSETPQPFFPRVRSDALGVDALAVSDFLTALDRDPGLHMHGVTVLHKGCILCEAAFGAQDLRIPKYTFSACKSIVSLCIGILIGDGKLSLQEKLVDLFPERINAVAKMRLSGMCVQDLLTMRTGIVFNELECQTDEDWVKCYLNSAISGEIGTTFAYNSLNTYMLAAILCKKTGMTLSEFAGKRLFAPLAITDYFWETCPAGIEKGGWGLYLREEDMAKLGMLVLHEGRFSADVRTVASAGADMFIDTQKMCNDIQSCMDNAPQIVPRDYIRDALTPHAKAPAEFGDFDYGYQIWVGREDFCRAYLFNGMLGQNVLIFPDTDTVIVTNAGNDEFFQTTSYYRIAKTYFGTPDARAFSVPTHRTQSEAEDARRTLGRTLTLLREHTQAELTMFDPPKSAQVPQPAPRSFLDGLRALFPDKKTAAPSKQPVPNPIEALSVRAPQLIPDSARPFLDRTFAMTQAADAAGASKGNAVGLLPIILQSVHSAYSGGFVSITLAPIVSDQQNRILITYREQHDTHVFQASIRQAEDRTAPHSVRSTLTFCGIPFRVAASCRFTADEDARPVCIVELAFLETPCSRTIKLFLNPTPHTPFTPDAVLRQEETPGYDMIARAILSQKGQLSAQPIIGSALGMIDDDYLGYRIRRMYIPELPLSVS